MQRITILASATLFLAGAGSLMAQEADSAAGAAQAAPVAQEQPAHDWEFTLSATDKAPGASATVMVADAESGSDFVLIATGLPVIDSLDEENRDVNAYTVWVVPGKERIAESKLVGVLTVTPDGTGRLESRTDLENFGVIVTATPDGAPEKIGGVPVLTGIPVQQVAPAADSAEEAVEETAEAAEEVADEVEEAAPEATPEATTSPTP
jgi:hypothetical protein